MFKNKTTYSFILFLTAFISVGNAQQVYLEAGVENAYFKNYENNSIEEEESFTIKISRRNWC